MADESLNEPVVIQASRIDANLLPPIFSQPYQLYVIQQGTDFGNVTNKANEAGAGAYEAQVKNDEQDVILNDHESRIEQNEADIIQLRVDVDDHELRITANTNAISLIEVRLTTVEGEVVTLRSDVDYLLDEAILTSESDNQSVQSLGGSFLVGDVTTPTSDKLQIDGDVNASVSYKVAGIKVIGQRQTGWTASSGTAFIGGFNADATYTVSSSYTQSEVQAISNGLRRARQRLKGVEDALRTHGLID